MSDDITITVLAMIGVLNLLFNVALLLNQLALHDMLAHVSGVLQ